MDPADLSALQAAGLYDPRAPNAAERLALIEWLAAQGVSAAQMVETSRPGATLTGLAGDLALRGPTERLTLGEVAVLAGTSPAVVERIRRAAGLPPAGADEKLFSPADATA